MDNTSLTNEELRIALELATLTSGAASSTLAMLVDQNLELSQPEIIEFPNVEEFIAKSVPPKAVLAVLQFLNGFRSPVGYIIDMQAATAMANVMMGGGGGPENEIGDIHLSAVGEAISQMMGAAANGISQFLSQQVDISAPEVVVFSPESLNTLMPELMSDPVVAIKYRLQGSTLIPASELIQLLPIEGFRQQVDTVRNVMPGAASPSVMESNPTRNKSMSDTPEKSPFETPEDSAMADAWGVPSAGSDAGESGFGDFAAAGVSAQGESATQTIDFKSLAEAALQTETPDPVPAAAAAAAATTYAPSQQMQQSPQNPVTVQPVEFPSFDSHVPAYGSINKNLELVMDVCLNLTVELGRTELPIKEVLELTRGSVIELNRVAGESVDLFANGKMIAKGEVVVIEDNFGLRITSIVSPADRLRGL